MTEQDLIDLIIKELEYQASRPKAGAPYVGDLGLDNSIVIDGAVDLASLAKLILKADKVHDDRMNDLSRLCEATGVLGADGHSSPAQVFERCLEAIKRLNK